MIRAQADVHLALEHEGQHLDLTGGIRPDHLDARGLGQLIGGDTIIKRDGARALHAQRGQLLDMVFDRRKVTAHPAGNDEVVDLDADILCAAIALNLKIQSHGSSLS